MNVTHEQLLVLALTALIRSRSLSMKTLLSRRILFNCVWMVCTPHQTFRSVGLITSGGGRDLDQVRRIGYPVFMGGTVSAHGYCHTMGIHEPIRVGGVMRKFSPVDLQAHRY